MLGSSQWDAQGQRGGSDQRWDQGTDGRARNDDRRQPYEHQRPAPAAPSYPGEPDEHDTVTEEDGTPEYTQLLAREEGESSSWHTVEEKLDERNIRVHSATQETNSTWNLIFF